MASSGVYVFRRNGRVAYVGRGDSDFFARMRRSFRQGTLPYDQYGCSRLRVRGRHIVWSASCSIGTTHAITESTLLFLPEGIGGAL
jgi:hypothetical protein